MKKSDIKSFLDSYIPQFNCKDFIETDPISIPHQFTQKQDIEIMGFFASILAWGNRKTIINNCNKLIELFEHKPYHFILNSSENDWARFDKFVHRTFNSTDLLYFIDFFYRYYHQYESLETVFIQGIKKNDTTLENSLNHFKAVFFDSDHYEPRTLKHIASPQQNSACKRLNMFLRWMVRQDSQGVDFGIWERIKPNLLLCPLDIHVGRTARWLGIITRPQDDWKTVLELTENLKQFNPIDPIIYDFALYGIGMKGLIPE